ncbi:MAG TPA: hypothetical protein PLI45_04885 [Candidatus Woesebacteria bacterium]|nr:hypothetical protein [Candidatus Woesebacteria bacterium]
MKIYSKIIKSEAKKLREKGKTSREINSILNQHIPKSTFTGWFRGIRLTYEQKKRISLLNARKLDLARVRAVKANKVIRNRFLVSLDEINRPISKKIRGTQTAKIALAMLCFGEASKYGSGSVFSLGNTNHKIITLFIKLLKVCFDIDNSKFRCTVMCRADQNTNELEKYWREITNIPKNQFYKTRIDPRSIGKPTKKPGYKGVLKVDYLDTKIQLELESLANLLYNQAVSL